MLEAARRPSLFIISALWPGLLFGYRLGLCLPAVIVILAGLGVCLAATPLRLRPVFLVAGFFMLGILRSPEAQWNAQRSPDPGSIERKFPVIARVKTPPLVGECTDRVRARVCEVIAGYTGITGSHVFLRGLESVTRPRGTGFTVIGRFRASRPGLNPYAQDGQTHNLRQGVIGEIDVENVVEQPQKGSRSVLTGLRESLTNLIADCSGPESRGMLEALLLGRRSNLSARLRTLMIKTGTYHVLAISGLHVGIVVLVLTSFLSVLRLGRTGRILVALVCVFCYVVFTGARPSAERAWTLFMLVGLAKLLQWKTDYPNCVCAAGTVLLLAAPHLAWDVGFKLSLGAVFGITLLVPQLGAGMTRAVSKLDKARNYVTLGLAASFAAQAFTLPVVLYHFGRVSLMGPLANLVLLPLVTLIVASGLEATIAMPVCHGLAKVFMRGASSLVMVLVMTASALTRFVNPLIYAGRPSTMRIVVYTGALAYLCLGKPRMDRRLKVILLVSLFVFLTVPFPEGRARHLRIVFFYVGNGDACLVEMPGGRTMLIDAGACGETFDAGLTYLDPFLAIEGRRRIDTVVITHSHNDHYGGLTSLIDAVEIGEVLVGTTRGEEQYEALLREMVKSGIVVKSIGRGDSLKFEDVFIEVLHPSERDTDSVAGDPNDLSVVLRLTCGNLRVLFTGDATPAVQGRLVAGGDDLTCDILKVPHHGAPDGVDTAFADALGARVAVISVGSRFSSHPCPRTINLLENSGMRTFSTLTDGAVLVVSDGDSTTVECHASGTIEVFGPKVSLRGTP
ncbi:MAG: DNA internalization-related competence protein ComEC/Rec2 [Candidatus Eisenbacteria bacterium]